MRHLRNVLLVLAWLGMVGLLHYELVHKAPRTPLGTLPGSELAARTETKVCFRAPGPYRHPAPRPFPARRPGSLPVLPRTGHRRSAL